MTNFLIVATTSLVLLGGQTGTEPPPVESLNNPVALVQDLDNDYSPYQNAYYRDGDDYEGHHDGEDEGDRHSHRHDDGDDSYYDEEGNHRHYSPPPHHGGYRDYGY